MFDIQNKLNKNHFHFFFLFILSLNYLVPYILFGKITLFYHDALDSEIVYNQIIGKYLSGDSTVTNLFLNGEIKFDYLRRIYQPIIFLYAVFETELAYWITDILIKLTSYISFFILSKKLNSSSFVCGLAACLFATLNIPTHNGFGIAISPYLIYLSLYKSKLSLKNFLVIIFFGLNADLIFTLFAIPFILLILPILAKEKFSYFQSHHIKIFSFFIFSLLVANSNLILIGLSEYEFHREEFVKNSIPSSQYLISLVSGLINYINEINVTFVNKLPRLILLPFLFLFIFLSRQKEAKNIFFLILLVEIILLFLNTELYANFYNTTQGLVKTLNIGYCDTVLPLLYCLATIIILKIKKEYIFRVFSVIILISILLGQVNSSLIPLVKNFVLKKENYRNVFTFKEYYLYQDYKKIKEIVKNKKTVSIGVDPMIAIVNGISTIDGYHNIYPLSYKKKFRKIIEKEIDKNTNFKKYYDNWGSRIYAFVNDPNEISINFSEAKNLGADFVISKYDLNSNNLELVCDDCSKFLKLYSIH
jgi:hypothetical protein